LCDFSASSRHLLVKSQTGVLLFRSGVASNSYFFSNVGTTLKSGGERTSLEKYLDSKRKLSAGFELIIPLFHFDWVQERTKNWYLLVLGSCTQFRISCNVGIKKEIGEMQDILVKLQEKSTIFRYHFQIHEKNTISIINIWHIFKKNDYCAIFGKMVSQPCIINFQKAVIKFICYWFSKLRKCFDNLTTWRF